MALDEPGLLALVGTDAYDPPEEPTAEGAWRSCAHREACQMAYGLRELGRRDYELRDPWEQLLCDECALWEGQ